MSADDFTSGAIALFTLAEKAISHPDIRARGIASVTLEHGRGGGGVIVELDDPPSRADLDDLAYSLDVPPARFASTDLHGVGTCSAWHIGPHLTVTHWEPAPVPCCAAHTDPDGCDKAYDQARDDVTGYHEAIA